MQNNRLQMCVWVLLSLVIEAGLLSHDQDNCGSEMDIFVKPAGTLDCNGKQPCYNLSEYLSSPQHCFTSNTTVNFLPGIHLLEDSITVSEVNNLTLVGSSATSSQGPTAIIECGGAQGGLVFHHITNLSIRKLSLMHCGRNVSENLNVPLIFRTQSKVPKNFQAALLVHNVHTLMVEGIHIEASTGYGLLGLNVLGDSQVLNSTFHCNNNVNDTNECHFQRWNELSGKTNEISGIGGNALFVFSNFSGANLRITDSQFSHGRSRHTHLKLGGGGLGIRFRVRSHNISVIISSCIFDSNAAHLGANVFIDITNLEACKSCLYAVRISNCTFSSGHASEGGGGLYLDYSENLMSYKRFPFPVSALTTRNFLKLMSEFGLSMFDYVYNSEHRNKLGFSIVIDIQISHSRFLNNSGGGEGGGIYALFGDDSSNLQEIKLLWVLKDCTFYRNEGKEGAGIYALLSPGSLSVMETKITGSEFQQNVASLSGGGMFLYVKGMFHPQSRANISVLLTDSYFTGNLAHTGAAMRITADSSSEDYIGCSVQSGRIVLANVVFDSNRAPSKSQMCTGTLHLLNVRITIVNSQFGNNHCSGLYTFNSKVNLKGKLEFVGNKALTGGAIHLDCTSESPPSLVCFDAKTKIFMANNTALENGGAIAAREDCLGNSSLWFSWQRNLPRVVLENNTATAKGDSIYVQSLNIKTKIPPSTFWAIFAIHGVNHPLEIAEPSYKACLCSESNAGLIPEWMEEDECPQKTSVSVYRGQSFNITVAGVGQYNYPIPSVLQTTIESESGSARLGIRQSTQELSYRCTNVTYSITGLEDEVRLHLSLASTLISKTSLVSYIPPAVINVTLLDCPLGFELVGKPPICSCASSLRYIAGISCDIDTTLIHHPPSMWIGISTTDSTIMVHRNCPFDYCKPGKTYVNLTNPDEQCNSNRAGVLCGACLPGLSLALGTSQCLQCSNIYLLLLLPFTLAGVAVVCLLLKCNLTVSVGTINGLIFYSNIIRVNHTIFFPKGNILTTFLSAFIAWINLDLGIETCFYRGMNAYAKPWLQFVFPAYIWILVGTMIFSSRYSMRIAKLTGSNAVQVLATLFLLSYAKLLRSVINAVSLITLTDQNRRVSLLWLQDGNVGFLQGVHIILFVMAMVTTFLYVVPFTLLTVLAPYLQTWSNLRVLRWVVKLKPILDAYQGPYKDRFRYWTGMMLVVRIVLFIVFASNTLGDPRVNLLAITVVLFTIIVCFWNSGQVYKSFLKHIIELFYLLNLGIFTAATQFLQTSQASPQKQEHLAWIMVGSAFAVFCAVLLYHGYQAVKNKSIVQYALGHCPHRRVQLQAGPDNDVTPVVPQPTISVVKISDLREPLLTEN